MQIFATFEHTKYLELGITELQENGITDIFAVPLKKVNVRASIIDSLNHSDGRSFLDKGFALAVVLSTILASKGFELEWGPIYWGLIGAASGIIIGLVIEIIFYKWKNKKKQIKLVRNEKHGEVILIINCKLKDEKLVSDILTRNLALGLAKVINSKE
ncbi:hypothetical protein ACIFOT_32015 [Neobacillus sp. NRS-1170]|uniref:hypothetical protein n=1 Tax=Neobacillus sp. NRS-1170 TaxID=3233898 RepID=UPI003D28D031